MNRRPPDPKSGALPSALLLHIAGLSRLPSISSPTHRVVYIEKLSAHRFVLAVSVPHPLYTTAAPRLERVTSTRLVVAPTIPTPLGRWFLIPAWHSFPMVPTTTDGPFLSTRYSCSGGSDSNSAASPRYSQPDSDSAASGRSSHCWSASWTAYHHPFRRLAQAGIEPALLRLHSLTSHRAAPYYLREHG